MQTLFLVVFGAAIPVTRRRQQMQLSLPLTMIIPMMMIIMGMLLEVLYPFWYDESSSDFSLLLARENGMA